MRKICLLFFFLFFSLAAIPESAEAHRRRGGNYSYEDYPGGAWYMGGYYGNRRYRHWRGRERYYDNYDCCDTNTFRSGRTRPPQNGWGERKLDGTYRWGNTR